jgi:hypothetical protein
MRSLMSRAFLAAVAAGGTLLMMGGPGAAATHSRQISTTTQAGYVATHNTFRFVSTTVKVPSASQKYASYAEVVLGGTSIAPATLGVRAGGGPGSVMWNVVGPLGGMGGGTMSKIAPKVGDVLTLSIYYNHKVNRDNFTVTDVTRKITQTLVLPPSPHTVYTAAETACLLPDKVTAPSKDVLLWAFSNTHVTTLAGKHGTMNGPWLTRKIIDVAADGHVVMSPNWLWNDGKNFGAWLRAAK